MFGFRRLKFGRLVQRVVLTSQAIGGLTVKSRSNASSAACTNNLPLLQHHDTTHVIKSALNPVTQKRVPLIPIDESHYPHFRLLSNFERIEGKRLNGNGMSKLDSDYFANNLTLCHNVEIVFCNEMDDDSGRNERTVRILDDDSSIEACYIDENGDFCDENGIIINTKEKSECELVYKRNNCFNTYISDTNDIAIKECEIEPIKSNNCYFSIIEKPCKPMPVEMIEMNSNPESVMVAKSYDAQSFMRMSTQKSMVCLGTSNSAASSTIGLSVGGAKDIDNFRENIKKGYLPQKTDITMEGIFYDYYFDTGNDTSNENDNNSNDKIDNNWLFYPTYSQGVYDNEYYLSVGLNSNLKQSDFKRKKLNLIVVLDISGSMSSSFKHYHYDRHNSRKLSNLNDESDMDLNRSKLDIAKQAVCGLLDHLDSNDRFGMVLFDHNAYVARPLNHMKTSDKQIIRENISKITTHGATDMEGAYKCATKLFEQNKECLSNDEYDNRIIFLTDDMPNVGNTNKDGFLQMTKSNATNENKEKNIYSTFVGVGVDFNSTIVDHITKIRGANYYSVQNSKQFLQRMNDEFDHMVTPLVFDLKLSLQSENMKVDKIYGSNCHENDSIETNKNNKKEQIMHIPTLFPSQKSETSEETRGGIILAKLLNDNFDCDKIGDNFDASAVLKVEYQDANGNVSYNQQNVNFSEMKNENKSSFYENTGVRKGVLLSRYVDLLHEWIDDACANKSIATSDNGGWNDDWANERREQSIATGFANYDNQWERGSKQLTVSSQFKEKFENMKQHFINEMKFINDQTLKQEIDILDELINFQNKAEQIAK